MINFDDVLNRANEIYGEAKLSKVPEQKRRYIAPEQRPTIESEQVKAVLKAVIEAINGKK